MENETSSTGFEALREKLRDVGGKTFWRSLEQVAETPDFRKWADDEFPGRSSLLDFSRRDALKLMGAAVMMASLAGCRRLPQDKVVPYAHQAPEDQVPGKSLMYASTVVNGLDAMGVLVEQRDGRPIKIEGNPAHPASLGATDVFAQASIFNMYDPDRTEIVRDGRFTSTWDSFMTALRGWLEASNGGEGIAVLSTGVVSPTLASQIRRFQAAFPKAKVHFWDAVNYDNLYEGAKIAFGEPLNTYYKVENADVVVALDADFLGAGPGHVRYAREWAKRRSLADQGRNMNRVYMVESFPTVTGAMADHRLALKPSQVESFARALAARLGLGEVSGGVAHDERFLNAVVDDLTRAGSRSVVIPGSHQSPALHALCHAINATLAAGNPQTYVLTQPIESFPVNKLESLTALVAELNAGRVDKLLILGGNPVYTAPADLGFADALAKANIKVHVSLHPDETSNLCDWHLPEAHELESWGDARAYDGTVSTIQPLIAPLRSGWSKIEFFERALSGVTRARELVKRTWFGDRPADAAERAFQQVLHSGVVPNSALAPISPGLVAGWASRLGSPKSIAEPLEAVILPDPTVGDGLFSNCGWTQELPKPMTSLAWDNAVYMAPRTAEELRVRNGQVLNVTVNGREVQGPAWVLVGMPVGTIALHLGYGRKFGAIAEGCGFDVYAARTSDGMHITGATVSRTNRTMPMANTQLHHQMEGRDIVRSGTLADYLKDPTLEPAHSHAPKKEISLYDGKDFLYDGQKWAMTIDLNTCVGCGVCTIACQAENNIPTVGKREVILGREMHWMRIDRYYAGNLDQPDETLFQPVACIHCELAPCEPVCPVAATVHSKDGLNQMIYNRCVGTRYCSNNCPYKVRRFNFLNYADRKDYPHFGPNRKPSPTLLLLNNPDVTVRGRGVMEKCTYCIQRIVEARVEAKKRKEPIKDGDVITACQQACPSQAIIFGDMADPNSKVSQSRADKRSYMLLPETNTRPRTTYLGRVKNPHPTLVAEKQEAKAH